MSMRAPTCMRGARHEWRDVCAMRRRRRRGDLHAASLCIVASCGGADRCATGSAFWRPSDGSHRGVQLQGKRKVVLYCTAVTVRPPSIQTFSMHFFSVHSGVKGAGRVVRPPDRIGRISHGLVKLAPRTLPGDRWNRASRSTWALLESSRTVRLHSPHA